jgi:hypothetical protein
VRPRQRGVRVPTDLPARMHVEKAIALEKAIARSVLASSASQRKEPKPTLAVEALRSRRLLKLPSQTRMIDDQIASGISL